MSGGNMSGGRALLPGRERKYREHVQPSVDVGFGRRDARGNRGGGGGRGRGAGGKSEHGPLCRNRAAATPGASGTRTNARAKEGNVDLIYIGDSIVELEVGGKPVWDHSWMRSATG